MKLSLVQGVMVRGHFVLGIALGFVFASFLIFQGVGFIYGGLRIADELRDSGYEYSVTKKTCMSASSTIS